MGDMATRHTSCTACTVEVKNVKSCTESTCEKVCNDADKACETFALAIPVAEDKKCEAAINTSSVELSKETQTLELADKCKDKAEWPSCTNKTGVCLDCMDVSDGSITIKQSTSCRGCSDTCEKTNLTAACKNQLVDLWKQTEEASNAG